MQPMYIVYTELQHQKKHLEGQFLQKSGHFAVPFYQLKTLKELIDKTCSQFYQKDESIFIEKLKNMILGLVDFNFSFPLWRQILSTLKRTDVMAERYRKYLIEVDKFFLENESAQNQVATLEGESMEIIDDEFEKALNSYKTLQVIDLEQTPIVSYPSFGQFDDQLSVKESQRTNDQSVKKSSKKSNLEINSFGKLQDRPTSFGQNTPIKMLQKSFQQELNKYSRNSKAKHSHNYGSSEQLDDFINSFKKNRMSPVAEMIIKDESLRQIAKKQKRTQKDRKKLEEELYEKTKTAKSKEYNRNIKTILVNRKVKDRRKPGFEGQRSTISGVVGAYELRRVASEIIQFNEEDNIKLFKSAGKPFLK